MYTRTLPCEVRRLSRCCASVSSTEIPISSVSATIRCELSSVLEDLSIQSEQTHIQDTMMMEVLTVNGSYLRRRFVLSVMRS